MRKKSAISLTSYEDLFKEEQDASAKEGERIQQVSLDSLQEFPNHPYSVPDNEELDLLAESIRENGVLHPIIVFPKEDGDGYLIISGHRRCAAAEKIGLTEVPAIVRNGTDVYLDPDRRTYDITNGNILILGGPGQGKSYLTKFLAGNVVEQGKNLYILDPEEEYRTEIANLDGTYIDFMSGEYRINILEPKRWAVDDILPLKKETGKEKKDSVKEGVEEISADREYKSHFDDKGS